MTVEKDSRPEQRSKPPQTIGAGYIVLRREAKLKRLQLRGGRPYEHANLKSARAEAARLAARFRDEFIVMKQVASIEPPAQEESVSGDTTNCPPDDMRN